MPATRELDPRLHVRASGLPVLSGVTKKLALSKYLLAKTQVLPNPQSARLALRKSENNSASTVREKLYNPAGLLRTCDVREWP